MKAAIHTEISRDTFECEIKLVAALCKALISVHRREILVRLVLVLFSPL